MRSLLISWHQNIRAMEREEGGDVEGHPLLEAVQSCIAAAAGEFDVQRQQVRHNVNQSMHRYEE